jgi:hypothetical protein
MGMGQNWAPTKNGLVLSKRKLLASPKILKVWVESSITCRSPGIPGIGEGGVGPKVVEPGSVREAVRVVTGIKVT